MDLITLAAVLGSAAASASIVGIIAGAKMQELREDLATRDFRIKTLERLHSEAVEENAALARRCGDLRGQNGKLSADLNQYRAAEERRVEQRKAALSKAQRTNAARHAAKNANGSGKRSVAAN